MFALVDCNNFYASCERVFNPALRDKPVLVLSNNDGCVIARSSETKALGIKMGQPAFEIKDIIERNNVHVFSSNFALYGDMSGRVTNILTEECPAIEVYSIDESFIDLSGFDYYDPGEFAQKLRKKILSYTGIPVSIGIGLTKTLAKAATWHAKKVPANNGVFVINSEEKRDESLKIIPVGDVWGIGRQYSRFLNENGVSTAWQYTQLSKTWVRKNMTVMGLRTQRELLGEPCGELVNFIPAKKAILTSRSFGEMLSDLGNVSQAVTRFASSCAYKLRKQKSVASILMVFITTNPHRKDLAQYARNRVIHLPVPTNSSIEINHYAQLALSSIFKEGFRYKKAGVIVSCITPQDNVQQALFDEVPREKHSDIMTVMDSLNEKYGRDTLRLGTQGFSKRWKLRQEKLSPCYTTRWEEFITIKL